ncbi:von Willebrand factor type A domain family protein [Acanthocheilonema viteae]
MIQILLIVVLIAVCKAQYGEVAPPAPIPPSNYASNDLEEVSFTNKPSYSESDNENDSKQIIRPEGQSSPPQLLHLTENITYGLPIGSETTSIAVTQSTTAQQKSGQTYISTTINSFPQTYKFPSLKQRTIISSSKFQSLSSRLSTTRTTLQTTRQSVTTQRPRIIFTSRRPALIVTKQSRTSRVPQITNRITRNQTSRTSRTTHLPSLFTESRRPQSRLIPSSGERLDCKLPFDTLFVVDSTSSVRQFFEDHRNYIIEIINLIFPEFDNEARIGLIEYSSPLRRQVKLPFIAHKNRTDVVEAIRKLPFFAGITATGAALKLALELLQDRRFNALTNVIVLTDGFSYDLVAEPSSILHRLPNVRTFTVTVTDSWREYELETIAGEQSRVFKGKNSARNLAKALISCDNGLSSHRSP